MAPVKKDTLPIVEYTMRKTLDVINDDMDKESKKMVGINHLSSILVYNYLVRDRLGCPPNAEKTLRKFLVLCKVRPALEKNMLVEIYPCIDNITLLTYRVGNI